MLSGGVKHALTFISRIGVVPLEKAGLLDMLPDNPNVIIIKSPELYKFGLVSKYSEILKAYFDVNETKDSLQNLLYKCVNSKSSGPLGSAYADISNSMI